MLCQFAHPVACCWMLLHVVAQSLKPVKLFSQQLPTFLLFRDRRSVAQQCWIRLHSSSNIVGATYAHYAWLTKTSGLYPSQDVLQVPTMLGVVASVCTPLPTRTQQLPTLLAQQCWELLHLFFARSLSTHGNSRASLCGLNAIFYELTVIKIHTSRFLTNQNASTISVLVFNEKIIK